MSTSAPGTKKYKVVQLGGPGVGKSSLVLRLVKDEWIPNIPITIGVSLFRYSFLVDDSTINFDIWNTAGQELHNSLPSIYYRGAAAALVVYDITSEESFEKAKCWIRELVDNSPETIITLVGNKSDLDDQRKVAKDEARRLAEEFSLMHFEASAKDGTGVQVVFQEIARKLAQSKSANVVPVGGVRGVPEPKKQTKKKGCCSSGIK